MSFKKSVIRRTSLAFPNSVMSRDIASLVETCSNKYYWHGLLIESTSYKNTLYIWEFVLPKFHPTHVVCLNFSKRISNNKSPPSDFFDGDAQDVADQIKVVADVDVDLSKRLASPISPDSFATRYEKILMYPDQFPKSVVFTVAINERLRGNWELHNELIQRLYDRSPGTDLVGRWLQTFEQAKACWMSV